MIPQLILGQLTLGNYILIQMSLWRQKGPSKCILEILNFLVLYYDTLLDCIMRHLNLLSKLLSLPTIHSENLRLFKIEFNAWIE